MNASLTDIYDFLLSQSVHLAILFFLIWVLAVFLRRRSAHLRYLLWLVILLKCLVPSMVTIPMAVLPENTVVFEQQEPAVEMQSETPAFLPEPSSAAEIPPNETEMATASAASPTAPALLAEGSSSPALAVSVEETTQGMSLWARLNPLQWAVLVWTTGFLLIMGVTVMRGLRFGRLLRHTRLQADQDLQTHVDSVIKEFWPGIRLQAYQLEGISQPFVWGLLHGAVYLPANFTKTGTDNTRSAVLLHEIAHVTRLDPLVNLVQIAIQAIYWFHPLVWLANRMIRSEREKCCDEVALAKLKTSPREYGSAIVDTLVNEYESRLAVPSLAVAGPVKNIEDRIKTIMKPGKRFYSRPPFKALVIILLLAAISSPLTFALTDRSSAYQAALSNGVTVQIVAVCEQRTQGKQWWRPDGSSVADISIITKDHNSYPADEPGYEIVYRSSGDHPVKIQSIKGSQLKSQLRVLQPLGLAGVRAHIQKKLTHTDIRVASPSGQWATAVKASGLGSTYDTVRGKKIILAVGQQDGKGLVVLASDELGYERATRVIALDADGQEHPGETVSDLGVQGLRQRSVHFSKLAPTQLKEIRFQICPYVYHTFKNVSLRPDVKTVGNTKTVTAGLHPATSTGQENQNAEKQNANVMNITFAESTSLQDALRVLANAYRKNIICSEEISGPVPVMELYDIESFENALKAILGNNRYVVDGNLIRIYTAKEYESLPLGKDAESNDESPLKPSMPGRAISAQDRHQIEQLMQDYWRVINSNDLKESQKVFDFDSEQQRARFLGMLKMEAQRSGHTEANEDRSVQVVQIEPIEGNEVVVCVLIPHNDSYYIAQTVGCVQTGQGWRVHMDLTGVIEKQQLAQEIGPEEFGRRQAQAMVKTWQNARGQELRELYDNKVAEFQRQLLMRQYAKRNDLQMPGGFDDEEMQRHIDRLNSRTPEELRAEMIADYRQQFGSIEQSGKLEFRIAPDSVESSRSPGPLTGDQEQAFRKHLQEHGPLKLYDEGHQYLWLPLHAEASLLMAVIEEYQGRKYILVSKQSEQIMAADGSWGLLAVYPTKDNMGRRAIDIELDEVGAQRFYTLTRNNIDRAMAIVMDGQVLSMPTIKTAIRKRAIVTGKFTEREIRSMVIALQKGMPAQKPAASSESTP
jgi:beta-lactamase regulating signal transducer with metallopeptidase domain/preprotein translocase subunit SecD